MEREEWQSQVEQEVGVAGVTGVAGKTGMAGVAGVAGMEGVAGVKGVTRVAVVAEVRGVAGLRSHRSQESEEWQNSGSQRSGRLRCHLLPVSGHVVQHRDEGEGERLGRRNPESEPGQPGQPCQPGQPSQAPACWSTGHVPVLVVLLFTARNFSLFPARDS